MKWNIEKSKINDCKAIAEFVTKTWNETYKGIVNDDFLNGLKETEKIRYTNAVEKFDEKSNLQYVIKDDDKIVAFLKLLENKDEEKNEYLELQALYVLKEYQNNKLGKQLMDKAFEEAKKMGGEFIKKREFKLPNQTLYENVYMYKL